MYNNHTVSRLWKKLVIETLIDIYVNIFSNGNNRDTIWEKGQLYSHYWTIHIRLLLVTILSFGTMFIILCSQSKKLPTTPLHHKFVSAGAYDQGDGDGYQQRFGGEQSSSGGQQSFGNYSLGHQSYGEHSGGQQSYGEFSGGQQLYGEFSGGRQSFQQSLSALTYNTCTMPQQPKYSFLAVTPQEKKIEKILKNPPLRERLQCWKASCKPCCPGFFWDREDNQKLPRRLPREACGTRWRDAVWDWSYYHSLVPSKGSQRYVDEVQGSYWEEMPNPQEALIKVSKTRTFYKSSLQLNIPHELCCVLAGKLVIYNYNWLETFQLKVISLSN